MKQATIVSVMAFALAAPVCAATPASHASHVEMDARIKALESTVEQLRQQAGAALAAAEAAKAEIQKMKSVQQENVATVAVPEPVASPASASASSASAFNPAIAVILNGVYANHSLDPSRYYRAGFPLVDGTGPGEQGLSLGESEFSFAANVDDKFYGQLTMTAENDHGDTNVGVEEAYIESTALSNGFTMRAGRFYSHIGYLNDHHTHTDNFVDRPLAYQAFLGNQYGDDGVQVRWVAPTDTYIELGGEAFSGNHFPSAGANHSGVGVKTAFAHVGGDIGYSSFYGGVSVLKARTSGAEDGFSGDQTLYLSDVTWKWAPHGGFKDGGVAVHAEYFLDDRNGTVVTPALPDTLQPWDGSRRGMYLEGVYRFSRTWDAGYRYDKLWSPDHGPYASDFDPSRNSVMLTWRNSEFSFLRLLFSRDEPSAGQTDNAISLQYQASIGAHGAHTF